ncbi:MAG: hypothetical protein VCD00_02545 [Candidatus Hydrogenedentota bacterium]
MIKRILKWTFRFAVVALLILIAITTNSWYGYRQAQADFRALGYPTTMEELRAWDAVDDPAENAAIPIQEAMNKMTWEFPEDLQLPVSSDCCWRFPATVVGVMTTTAPTHPKSSLTSKSCLMPIRKVFESSTTRGTLRSIAPKSQTAISISTAIGFIQATGKLRDI